jgi:hypothetical protein
MKKDYRKELVSNHLLEKKQEKQRIMQELLKKNTLDQSQLQDNMTKLTGLGRSRSNSSVSSEYQRSKWDIPMSDLEIDYNNPIGRGQFGVRIVETCLT